jgi:hypothetical protein
VGEYFGWFSHFARMDNISSSEKTRRVLGWEPSEIGLIADLGTGRYFED